MASRLAVVVPTTHPWPEVRPCLDALLAQAAANGASIIVADGERDGRGVADDVAARHADVLRVERHPGASVFELRAAAVAVATADPTTDVIAVTEDHCVPAPDWCARILDDFDRHPEVLSVAGAVGNGSRRRLIDRANFFLTFAPAVAPIDPRQYVFPPVSNVSFRRTAVPSGALVPGDVELQLGPRLLAEGRTLVDDAVVVEHVQSHGFLGTFAAHYNNGRASLGLANAGLPWPARRRRLGAQLRSPYRTVRATHRALRSKQPAMTEAAAAFPLIALLACCYAAGAVVGVVFGPGESPSKLS